MCYTCAQHVAYDNELIDDFPAHLPEYTEYSAFNPIPYPTSRRPCYCPATRTFVPRPKINHINFECLEIFTNHQQWFGWHVMGGQRTYRPPATTQCHPKLTPLCRECPCSPGWLADRTNIILTTARLARNKVHATQLFGLLCLPKRQQREGMNKLTNGRTHTVDICQFRKTGLLCRSLKNVIP